MFLFHILVSLEMKSIAHFLSLSSFLDLNGFPPLEVCLEFSELEGSVRGGVGLTKGRGPAVLWDGCLPFGWAHLALCCHVISCGVLIGVPLGLKVTNKLAEMVKRI